MPSNNPSVLIVLQASKRGWKFVLYHALDKACLLGSELIEAIRTAYRWGCSRPGCRNSPTSRGTNCLQ